MIETRRGQPMRLVGPGNFSSEARVSLNDPQSPASCGLPGPFAPTLRPPQHVLLANRTYWHRSKMCAGTRTHAHRQRCPVLGSVERCRGVLNPSATTFAPF